MLRVPRANDTITAIAGIKVGHVTNSAARTGCTVVLCEAGAVAGVDVRGSAPGTRETDAIRPGCLVLSAHAVLLTGGSAFGLDAASGVMQYLEERDIGFAAGPVRVPIVPAAVIFDLRVGDPKVRPDLAMGYQACVNATDAPVAMGVVGAGTGATVGKLPGLTPCNGGLGSVCTVREDSGLMVGAIVVVNAVGSIIDPATGAVLAGAREAASGKLVEVEAYLAAGKPFENTTIGVVATNAALTPTEATKVAQMAHDGLARTIRPIHTMFDGDTIFTLATGKQQASVNTVGILAAEVMAQAVLRSVAPPRAVTP
jgi:L-aminopeptidase/D-esterase-like protein